MARARNVKPALFKNELLADLDPVARLLFVGLWTIADREGRLEDRPKRIKGELFPYDSFDVEPHLDGLAKHGFILRYEVDDVKYIQVINFLKHQKPHQREVSSVIPAPETQPRLTQGTTQAHTSPADSLLSDSLNPTTTLSGRPDDSQGLQKKPNGVAGQALEVLTFLNEKTGRKFRGLDANGKPTANLDFIIARIKTGVSVQDCKTVIARKTRDWLGTDQDIYLRPETLFNKRKFESYLGQCTTTQVKRD